MARATGRASSARVQMVVGDDEVEAEAARGFSFSEGAHAGVDGDDEADTVGVSRFKNARLHAVAFAEAMGDVKAGFTAEHFDGGFEQDDGDGAIDVVVAVEENGLAGGDGALEAIDGGGHAEHEEGIVEVRDFGIEEDVGGGCSGDAAGDEEFGEDLGKARFFCEGLGGGVIDSSEGPALTRELARGRSVIFDGESWNGRSKFGWSGPG